MDGDHERHREMIVSSPLFEAYLECDTKCWLRAQAEPRTGNIYAEWVRLSSENYCEDGRKRFLAMFPENERAIAPPLSRHAKDSMWRVATDVRLQTNRLASSLQGIERMPSERRNQRIQFIPYRFQVTNKITKNHKLSLAFDALVLSEATGCDASLGKIIHGDGYVTFRVKLSPLVREVRKRIADIAVLLTRETPPDLVLNRHCNQCEFQSRCRKLATEKDELSLLSGLSERERKKLHDRGLFTITQLSYTFRPRRRGREFRGGQEKFHHSLRAIAIREKKIHAVDLLAPQLEGTPIYLDVEGLPDRDFYYLIGVRVGTGDDAVQQSFWADDENGEKEIWTDFLSVLSAITNPQIIHFGSYETLFLKRMSKRYGGPRENSPASTAIDHAVNLLSFVFAQVYFPTHSNGLKDIAEYLGFKWSAAPRSGLEAIVWRSRWEASRDLNEKQALLRYNREDCEAVELVAKRLIDLYHGMFANDRSQNDVILASEIKPASSFPLRFGRNTFAVPELEIINKAAYWHYQRERVYVKSRPKYKRERERHLTRRRAPIPNATIECPRVSRCPSCKCGRVYSNGKRSKIVVDLKFMRHGIKRWITRYVVVHHRCSSCGSCFYTRDPCWPRSKYGPGLAAYTVYQNIELHLPQARVAASVKELFGLCISRAKTNQIKAMMAQTYADTYDDILKRLCSGSLLHIDETSASVMGKNAYVWVLTSMEEVAYFYSPTREGDTIQAMLRNFSGVLVSDFYAAYDAIDCPQQKCLIHLIRDMNEELLKHPFDEELKGLVASFAGLVRPMVETVDQRGLKKHFLTKHRISVDRFYKHLSGRVDTSEISRKIVERLQKNRERLFTFLEFDGVPWNNNNAEHAIKAFAKLRRVIEGKTTEKGLREFLILLSICETCKYKGVAFLDFVRSGSKSIDDFANQRTKQRC
jgi:predicted RecB family nuclease